MTFKRGGGRSHSDDTPLAMPLPFPTSQAKCTPFPDFSSKLYTLFRLLKQIAHTFRTSQIVHPFPTSQANRTPFPDFSSKLHTLSGRHKQIGHPSRLLKQIAYPFQTSQANWTPFPDFSSKLHTLSRLLKQIAHPFQTSQVNCTPFPDFSSKLHTLSRPNWLENDTLTLKVVCGVYPRSQVFHFNQSIYYK